MRRKKQKSTRQTIAKSFGHAFDGIFAGLEERNMKIHCTMAALVIFFGLILHISVTEWCICFVLFGLIMGLELVNTAIEALCDLVTQEYKPLAKRAKDTAAGAVLIASIMAATAGLIIFIPRLLYVLRSL
jgi:diacylglycerol kinase (ATP)